MSCQVAVNIMSFVWLDGYMKYAFYLNHFFGCNMLFAVFMVAFTHWFKFCALSRYAAWAELLFGINYLFVQEDNLYNILFQIIVGSVALLLTSIHYVKKFPFCKLSLVVSFLSSIFSTGSCEDAFRHWDDKMENKIDKHIFNSRSHEYKP